MNKQTICAKHLKVLTGIRWKNFKRALCSTKPPGKAEGIKMGNLNDKSVEYVVESIFRCYTKRRGPGTIMKILKDVGENEIRISIQRDIREASKAMKEMQARSMGSKGSAPNDNSVSSSGIPVKKIIRPDGGVPRKLYNIVRNVNTKTRPIMKPPSQATKSSKNIETERRASQSKGMEEKQEPNTQVNPIQVHITMNMIHATADKPFEAGTSHVSFKGPSQSEQSLPNTSMEKEINNIVTRHLKTLREDDIASFKDVLCFKDPPLEEGRILTSEVKDKSVEDMVDLIIRRHTVEHVEKTVTTILALMKENNMKMLIEKDFIQLNQQRNEKRKVSVF